MQLFHKIRQLLAVKEVRKSWKEYGSHPYLPHLAAFCELASRDEVVGKLFPVSSHFLLGFSRCTDYPFDTEGLPHITALKYQNRNGKLDKSHATPASGPPDEGEILVVIMGENTYIGEGNAETVLKIVKSLLPPDIGPARKGSRDKSLIRVRNFFRYQGPQL